MTEVLVALGITAFWAAFAWWFIKKDDGGKVIVDRWWLGNEERWASLRPILLGEVSDGEPTRAKVRNGPETPGSREA